MDRVRGGGDGGGGGLTLENRCGIDVSLIRDFRFREGGVCGG